MGGGRFTDTDWKTYSSTRTAGKSTKEVYTSRSIDKDLDPTNIKIRESRDSADNPNSNAIIVGLDVTGSMHAVLDVMAREGLKTLVAEIYNRKPVVDPHILCAGIGDVEAGDEAPLQLTQFEADIRIAEQLTKIYLEGGGGGNNYESYALVWYFAAMYTSIDCFEKRNKKGYLFTIGDEQVTPYLKKNDIKTVFGNGPQADLNIKELYTMASRQYNIFHLMVEEGSYMSSRPDAVVKSWTEVIGQNAIRLADHKKLAEVIVSIIQTNEGFDKTDVIESWDGSTALAVKKALDNYSVEKVNKTGEVVRF